MDTPKIFVIILNYVASINQIDEVGSDHVDWLERGYEQGVFLASGRRLPRTGGIILAVASSIDGVKAWMSHEPFLSKGLATADIYPFEINMTSEKMREAIESSLQLAAP